MLELVLQYASNNTVYPNHRQALVEKNENKLPLLDRKDVLASWNKKFKVAFPKFAKYSDSAHFNREMAEWYAGWRTLNF